MWLVIPECLELQLVENSRYSFYFKTVLFLQEIKQSFIVFCLILEEFRMEY